MADLVSVTAALGAVKHASDLLTIFRDSTNSLDKAEANLKLAELFDSMADIKMKLADIKIQIIEKDEAIDSLKKQLNTKSDIKYERFAYFKNDGDGPFCQQCYDKESKVVRLQNNDGGYWICKVCNSTFRDPNMPKNRGLHANRQR